MNVHAFVFRRCAPAAVVVVVAGTCVAPPACAQPPAAAVQPGAPRAESTDAVVAKVRQALGIDAYAKHASGVQLEGKSRVSGMDCSFWFIADGAGHFAQRSSGPVTITAGFDGSRAWTEDMGGERRLLESGERERTLLISAIFSGNAFGSSSPLTFSLETPKGGAPADAVTLNFRLKEGLARGTVEIDRATSLPRRWVLDSPVAVQTFVLSGTVTFGGLTFPAKVEHTSTNGLNTVTTITRASDAPLFARSPYEPVLAPPNDVTFDNAISPSLEVKRAVTGHILVHPAVNGKDVGWFILDTGAGANCLDSRAAEELGVERFGSPPANGAGGTVTASFGRAGSLTLGPATIDKPLMTVLDLSGLDGYMGTKVGGIIGFSTFHRVIAEVDFGASTVSIHDPSKFELKGAEWRRLAINNRLLTVEGEFEGHKGLFRLDTGAGHNAAIIHAPAVEQFKLLEGRETSAAMLGGVGGTHAARQGTLAWFEVGGERTENVGAQFCTEKKGVFGDEYTLGTIGAPLIRPFRLVLDYQHGKIAFVKREIPANKD